MTLVSIAKAALSPAFYKQQLNCYIKHVRTNYIQTGKPDFIFQLMVAVGIIGYSMPYFSTHSKSTYYLNTY